MIRIRYEKTEVAGLLRSAKAFITKEGTRVWAWLDTAALTFRIADGAKADAIGAGSAVSVPKLKLYAKKTLEHLGVTFDKEERDRAEDPNL